MSLLFVPAAIALSVLAEGEDSSLVVTEDLVSVTFYVEMLFKRQDEDVECQHTK